MRKVSKADTSTTSPLFEVPGNIVVTGPRQCGMTRGMCRKFGNDKGVLMIVSNGTFKTEISAWPEASKCTIVTAGMVHFDSIDGAFIRNGRKIIKCSDFHTVCVDNAAWFDKWKWLLAALPRHRFVVSSTGCNTEEWVNFVHHLGYNYGYSMLFANPYRRPDYKEQKLVEMGEEVFDREFRVGLKR